MPCFCSSLCVGHSTIHMLLIIICRLAALLCLFFVLSVYCFLVCCIVLCPIASNILLHFSLFIVRYYKRVILQGALLGRRWCAFCLDVVICVSMVQHFSQLAYAGIC